jgi:hypothetical protein
MNTVKERFWKYVDKRSDNECWPWIGYLRSNEYGRILYGGISVNGRNEYAHRLSWSIANKISLEKLSAKNQILHSCDNPKCVNPKHLRLGDRIQNMNDMLERKRQYRPVGEKNPRSKLTAKHVEKIRILHPALTQNQLAILFQVTRTQISYICGGKSWIKST